MPRIRTIKPEFFFDEELADLPAITRLFFIGLWAQADRKGRLEDRPTKLKAQILPYEKADVDALLNSLQPKFLVRYEIDGKKYLWIKAFDKHQRPHHTEAESCIPAYGGESTVGSPLQDGGSPLEKGKEKGRERSVSVEPTKDGGSTVPSPLSPDNGLDPELTRLLSECPFLTLVASADSAAFWDRVLGTCEDAKVKHPWLAGKVRQWDQWFASHPDRKSRDRKKLEARLMSWLTRDLERLARTGQ